MIIMTQQQQYLIYNCILLRTKIAQTTIPTLKDVLLVIDSLKKHVATNRLMSIQKRVEENRQKLVGLTDNLFKKSKEIRSTSSFSNTHRSLDLLTKRQKDAIDAHNGFQRSNGGKESSGYQEDSRGCKAVLVSYDAPDPNSIVTIMLPQIERIPTYTTWLFLDRNELMTESVEGRRQIYYDRNCGETLICSDSEEDMPNEEEEKRDFIKSEDFILCMTIKELGLSDIVLESLGQCFSRDATGVKERYETLSNKDNAAGGSKTRDIEGNFQSGNLFLEKDLGEVLGSFDNLFCRRCHDFVCRLHGCNQDLVFPADKQTPWSPPDSTNAPCGPNCFRLVLNSEIFARATSSSQANVIESHSGDVGEQMLSKKFSGVFAKRQKKCSKSESASSNAKSIYESSGSGNGPIQDIASSSHSILPKIRSMKKGGIGKTNSKRVVDCVLVSMQKRQNKAMTSNSNSTGEGLDRSSNKIDKNSPIISSEDMGKEFVHEKDCQLKFTDDESWKPLEKGLLDKGMQIFGRNSCLIARNMLNGLKTCWEVYQYIDYKEGKMSVPNGDAPSSPLEVYFKGNKKVRRRSKFLRRRGRVGRLRYTWKSTAYRTNRKRITERKDQLYKQYNPCGCQSACVKQCPCRENGTYCEKYCGCPDSCKIRFRGCRCAKSQCQSRQCPCFAAQRECDPDVCRNCWVGCGDGTLGIPGQRGDNECRNMQFLLRQQRRILLAKSDVHGWGAFLKDKVEKNEFLGEYTGELISHREADKRGKIYDRENSTFLFNLNDQFVVDAHRKGNKLKFANHSPHPNCHAKVVMVAGDHRVGIFATDRIAAGEEIFYNYRFAPECTPDWVRKLEASGSKKENGASSSGRAGRAKKSA
ncbi:PREDICTED: histone-lysine N-methyltransferase CLF-like isoform X1 [Lupinus angustifolius]|uniref:histone-lysine N-methyltransferase CLF-like isoform X1 n=1 Tax=Lupinus angustifolius TaxID=3871 RepID=UPI00092EB0F6|nr:PREDICTED: histone-lysine N-methyltransferase CLF-like isoform X1 [Lupinus angustifolius]